MAANNAINQAYTATTSWTPVVAFGGASVGITYGTQTGSYIRIGNLVYIRATIVLTNKGSSTGTVAIGGVPFSAANFTAIECRVANMGFTGSLNVSVAGGGPILNMWDENVVAGTVAELDDTNFTNTSSIEISGCYIA